MVAMRVVSRHVVKPAEPTWNGILPLSELDQIGIITHTTVIYFYNTPTQDDWLNDPSSKYSKFTIINTLKGALSRVLVPFYPLAGRLHWIDGQARGRLELECTAMGAELIEAESSEPMSCLGDFSSCRAIEDLIPRVSYSTKPIEELPLFLVQLTWFQCGGLSLGIAISHAVVDGLSAFPFFQEWARLARGLPLEIPPYLDRRILQSRPNHQRSACRKDSCVKGVDEFSRLPTLIGEANNLEERKKKAIATMLILSKSRIRKLKTIANRGLENIIIECHQYSRFEVVAAHIWRCACKARGHNSEQPTALYFSVDSRRCMDPPLPERYFGNAVVNVVATSQAGELMFRPLSYACSKIREAKEKVTNEYVWSTIEFIKAKKSVSKYQDYQDHNNDLGDNEGVFYGNPNLGVTSWLNLPARGLDFGWGKEILMAPGNFELDGDFMILPGYNEDGSIMVTVGLQALHMENFKKYFYEDIDALEFALVSRI